MKHAVVIPTYNAGAFIVRALESVRLQTLSADQIIVIDDGSNDNTVQVVNDWSAEHDVSVVLESITNSGAGTARNRALELVTADWVSFLDADDEWAPDKLTELDLIIADDASVEFVHTDRVYVMPSGEILDSAFRAGSMVQRDYLCSGFTMKTSTVSIAHSFLNRTGLLFGTERTSEDYSLFWRAIIRAKRIGYIDRALTVVHERQGSLTRSDNESALILDNIGVLAAIIDSEPTSTVAAKNTVRTLRRFRYRLSQQVFLVDRLSPRRLVSNSRRLRRSLGFGEFVKVLASVAVALPRRHRKGIRA
ncbi:glycosyltransferase family 2 protein [Salinisphaera aquimarina]|uniref:Glycosyltransferase family 2 protein n=1 Tax=Salinisphaera aquimarina TaxID=2094031 RepID=A0ABV7ESD5_9GAMM